MSYFVGGAVIGSALIGAYSSDKASKESEKGIKSGINAASDLSRQARSDVIGLFEGSSRKKSIGLDQALSFYKQNAIKRMQPFVQGNQAAQNVIGQGAQQANNAILGLPVDMSFVNQQQPNVDYTGINAAAIPQLGQGYDLAQVASLPEVQAEPTAVAAVGEKVGFGGDGPFLGLDDKKRFDLVELGKNPLGLSDKNYEKIDPENVTKKVNNKIKKVFGW